jgi:hypothetical protein
MTDYVYKIRMKNVMAALPISRANPSFNTTILLANANESQFLEVCRSLTYFILCSRNRSVNTNAKIDFCLSVHFFGIH